jgi:hypothetical protein
MHEVDEVSLERKNSIGIFSPRTLLNFDDGEALKATGSNKITHDVKR